MPEKTPAQYRKEVYDLLSGFGVKLTGDQQHQLSDTLKSVHDNPHVHGEPSNVTHEHRITCPKCQGLKIRIGRRFKDYRKVIAKAGGDTSEQV